MSKDDGMRPAHKRLLQQFRDDTIPLSGLEAIIIRKLRRYFSPRERGKVYDLIYRFVMAWHYTGELKFDFKWLLEAEKNYDPVIEPETDVLRGIRFEE